MDVNWFLISRNVDCSQAPFKLIILLFLALIPPTDYWASDHFPYRLIILKHQTLNSATRKMPSVLSIYANTLQ